MLADEQPLSSPLPELVTFHNERYFPHGHAGELVRLRDAICRQQVPSYIKDALLLALVSTLEDVSCLHKDGRLLRHHPRQVIAPREALCQRVRLMIEDLQAIAASQPVAAHVRCGDARRLDQLVDQAGLPRQYSVMVYSPPYLNNYDYSEIYKCELWLLGFIQSVDAWRRLRLGTFRSHHSICFPATDTLRSAPELREVHRLVEQAARCRDMGGYAQERMPRIIRGYFDDIAQMLAQQVSHLALGGYIACVVGNWKHGALHIPTDALIAKTGIALGLDVVDIHIVRHRRSRTSKNLCLRESVVVFRKQATP